MGLALAGLVTLMQVMSGQPGYYWQIMLPGAILGTIVGYATVRYPATGSAVRSVQAR